ncbi:hypothetical protein C9374_007762 [Naegleria lovaniensis]|uniref:Uncharacterized protein n=1 Tax=Naegleria lovaniensis TaxID=51637 RepID=A0AA88KLP4_NAELO|nr:uncharacterized protein C9374_007762 [Naegleria lovaniensis]KAG2379124.1 hypothetical protein C9374_007762 [Naegleria lovaniensis]
MTNSDSNSPSTPSSPSSLNHQENNPSPMKSSRKKRMDSKNHIIDIHMRPNLERIIGNEKTLQCFRSFADKKQVLESLDCLVEIKKYKSHLEPLLSQQQQQQQNGLY